MVVGGGFAGVQAASELAAGGLAVTLLEARDRLGGRAYSRPFAGTGPTVELGGSWMAPGQDFIREAARRLGVGVSQSPPPSLCRWLTAGKLRSGLPVDYEELGELERVLSALRADSQAGERRAVSLGDYLDELAAPASVRDFVLGWWEISGACDERVGAVGNALDTIRHQESVSLSGALTSLRDKLEGGTGKLVSALAGEHALEVRLDAQVTRLEQGEGAVEAVLTSGERLTARAAVVAVPVNAIGAIEFSPEVSAAKQAAFGSSVNTTIKVWMLARGVPLGALGVGQGFGLHWLRADIDHHGDSLVVAFGHKVEGFDPTSRPDVVKALAAFFPEAELLAWDWHDWNADFFARGGWASAPAGGGDALSPTRWDPEGRLAFASSDFAPAWAGWIEGALVSGLKAAAEVRALLDRA